MKLKVERNAIYSRIKELELEPIKQVGTSRYYDINDFQEIKTKQYKSILLARNKMLVIQYWSMMRSYKYNQEIADELGITLYKLQAILVEYKNNDNCITVKSKLC